MVSAKESQGMMSRGKVQVPKHTIDMIFRTSVEEIAAKTRDLVQGEPDGSMYDSLRLEGDAIRLLELLPGVDGESVQCRLLVSPDIKSLPYEALSYVWGNPEPQRSITVNGAPWSIGPNLHSAFECLRLEERPRIVWTDALCINQKNNAEKAVQVAKMGDIYKLAERVLIYLGPDEEGSSMLFDFMEAGAAESQASNPMDHVMSLTLTALEGMTVLAAQLLAMAKGGEPENSSSQSDSLLVTTGGIRQDSSSQDSPVVFEAPRSFQGVADKRGFDAVRILHAFVRLMERPWWTRVWIAQEISLAQQDPWVYCGRRHMPVSTLTGEVDFLMPLISEATTSAKGRLASELPPNVSASKLEKLMMFATSTLKTRGLHYAIPLAVFYQQSHFPTRDCKDDRDRVFGFRSLLDPIYRDICYPDYQRGEEDLYKKHATWILGVEGYGEILCKFRLGTRFRESWVPDFSKPFTLQRLDRVARCGQMCLHKGTLLAVSLLYDRIKTTRKISAPDDVQLVQELWRFEQETWRHWDLPALNPIYPPQPLLRWSLFSFTTSVNDSENVVSWVLPSFVFRTELSLFCKMVVVVDSSTGHGPVPTRETDDSGTISVSGTALQAAEKIANMAEFSGCVLFDYQHFSAWLDTMRNGTSNLGPNPNHSMRPRYRCDEEFYKGATRTMTGIQEPDHDSHCQQTCTLLLILADRVRDMVFPDPDGRQHKNLWPTLGKAASVNGPLSFKYDHPEAIRLAEMGTATIARDIEVLKAEELKLAARENRAALRTIIRRRHALESGLESKQSELRRDNRIVDLRRKELLDRMRGRQWFVTESGFPGVGVDTQDGFEVGDILSMVSGVNLPMIIRDVDVAVRPTVHRLVGAARVRGLVDDEVWKKVGQLEWFPVKFV